MAANDPKDLIIPVSRLRTNTTLPGTTPKLASQYTNDWGKFETASLKPTGELKEIWLANPSGFIGLATRRHVKGRFVFEGDLKHVSVAALAMWMGGTNGGAPNPGKVYDLFAWCCIESQDEPVVASGSNAGEGIMVYHSWKGGFQITGDLTANGTEFATLKLTGEVYLGTDPGIMEFGTRPITPAV